jgi:hypothetical protein
MSDEQRVRNALSYEMTPWQPDATDLMRRGKRMAWLRRGLAAAGVTTLAGTVATVSAAVGGPAPVKNLLAGGSKPPVPAVVPAVPHPSVDPTCLPAEPQLPKVTVSIDKTIDPNAVPTVKPSLPAKPTLPGNLPTIKLPGKPTLPTTGLRLPTGKPTIPASKVIPTGRPSLPATKPSLPGKPQLPTSEPQLPTSKPQLPTSKPSLSTGNPRLPGKPTLPSIPATKPSLPNVPRATLPAQPSLPVKPTLPAKPVPTLPDCVHGVPTTHLSAPQPKPVRGVPGKPSLPTAKATVPSVPKPSVPTVTVSGRVTVTIAPGKMLYPTSKPSLPAKPTLPTAKPTLPTPSLPTSFPTGHPSSNR